MTYLTRRIVIPLLALAAIFMATGCDYNDEDEAGVQDARQTSVVYPAGTSDLTAETPPGTTGEDVITETIVIENGQFDRADVTFPAGEAVALVIDNRDG